jgi:3-phytase
MKSLLILSLIIILYGCNNESNDEDSDSMTTGIIPAVETSPSINNGAKTTAFWIHPTDTALSAIIGGIQGGNLEVYNLQGFLLHFIPDGEINGIDLRYHFLLNSQPVALIAIANRILNQLGFYTINPNTLQLTNVIARTITVNFTIKNLCMYYSILSDKYYVIVMDNEGIVQQWELLPSGDGTIDAKHKRRFKVNSKINACVSDDQYAHLYIAAQTGIFKYGAEPQDGTANLLLETSNPVSSLSLYYANGQTGYLLASTPNNNRFLVYQRGNDNILLGDFAINAGNGFDSVEQSQGIAMTNVALNQTFQQGVLVAQDTENTEPVANTNYKLVAFERIAQTLNLEIDTQINPRQLNFEEDSNIKLVQATVETEPVPVGGDAADDIAIWVHPEDTALSTIIGTQKQGGLAVYDLTGQQIQYLPDGRMNNVDLRNHFPLGTETITLVAASNRTNDSIALYKVNSLTRQLENIAARIITVGLSKEIYGLCMYHNPLTHQYYVFVNDKNGEVEQWEVFENQKKVDAKLVRRFSVGSQTEGCVADDEFAQLYIGEENVGIWKYRADPYGGETRIQIDTTDANGHLTADVEGLAIYNAGQGNGYLIASSQGNNAFTIYQRTGNNEYIGTFRIIANETLNIDGVSDSDGIDVINVPLGNAFPFGVFIAQDGWNSQPVAHQNFKFVPWEKIADAFGLVK